MIKYLHYQNNIIIRFNNIYIYNNVVVKIKRILITANFNLTPNVITKSST
jgi:hypothetical protein